MDREIKFRVWDKEYQEMLYPTDFGYRNGQFGWTTHSYLDIGCCTSNSNLSFINEIVLQQYIGLKDKTGKEIYEGDILKTEYKGVGCGMANPYSEIKYENGSFTIFNKTFKEWNKDFEFWTLEVVGNVFENPELLK